MKQPPRARPGEVNWALVDRFTIAHFFIGILYGHLGFSFLLALFFALFWELIENPLKAYLPFLFPHATADTWMNGIGDILAVCLGWCSYSIFLIYS